MIGPVKQKRDTTNPAYYGEGDRMIERCVGLNENQKGVGGKQAVDLQVPRQSRVAVATSLEE